MKWNTDKGCLSLPVLIAAGFLLACGPTDGGAEIYATPSPAQSPSVRDGLADRMDAVLGAVASSVDFSLCVEDMNGFQYGFDRGGSTMSTMYESASTSKLVTAVTILRQVDKGYLSLDDHPQDWIDGSDWTIPEDNPRYGITLAQLLSFTSGLTENAENGDAYGILANQVAAIAAANTAGGNIPGTEFYYNSNHMQVAGLMAIRARRAAAGGTGFLVWNDLFDEFKAETGLFAASIYDLPGTTNPRLAGGMHWTGEEYLAFLRALAHGRLLSPALMAELLADHTPSAAVTLGNSPVMSRMNEAWHYGLGLWQECRGSTYDGTPGTRVSCPGAFGAYPFWDRERGYFGIVARQGSEGTFPEGITIERSVEDLLGEWAAAAP